MPRKTASGRKAASAASPVSEPTIAASKAKYEQELKGLARKAQSDGASPLARLGADFRKIRVAIAFVFFAGFFAHASQRSLGPVYGSIPAATYHLRVLAAAAFAGWAGNLFVARTLEPLGLTSAALLPVVTLASPLVQYLLEPYSGAAAGWGPLVAELLTLFPVVLCAAACTADALEGVRLSFLPKFLADSVPGMGSWALLLAFESLAKEYVMRFGGRSDGPLAFALTRVGMQLSLGGLMAGLAPSLYLLLALPAVLHTVYFNPHMPTVRATVRLNATLQQHDWLLMDRRESNTGYLSVLQSLEGEFRVMRCDHSLLGGEYTGENLQVGLVAEPIYGVFAMLEAVRLIQTGHVVPDSKASALVM